MNRWLNASSILLSSVNFFLFGYTHSELVFSTGPPQLRRSAACSRPDTLGTCPGQPRRGWRWPSSWTSFRRGLSGRDQEKSFFSFEKSFISARNVYWSGREGGPFFGHLFSPFFHCLETWGLSNNQGYHVMNKFSEKIHSHDKNDI